MKKYNLRVIQNLVGEDNECVFNGTKAEVVEFIKNDYKNWGDLVSILEDYAGDQDITLGALPFECNEEAVFVYLLEEGEEQLELIDKFLSTENLWRDEC